MGNIKVRNSGAFAQMKNVKSRSGGSLVQAKKVAIRSSGAWVTALNFIPEAPALTATNTTAYANTLSWNAPSTFLAITNYTLQRSPDNSTWTTIFTSSTRTYVDTGLTQNTTYYYRVLANTAVNSGPYSSVVTQATRVATVKRQTFNSTGTWTKPAGVTTVDVLVVAGGQGGGGSMYEYVPDFFGYQFTIGGGGGGGQVVYSAGLSVPSATYTCTVGAGGSGGPTYFTTNSSGSKGANSSFGSLVTALGNFSGNGGTYAYDVEPRSSAGVAGANGGFSGVAAAQVSGITGRGGGGGGASAAGSVRNGGAGVANNISGTSVTYGRGGFAAQGFYNGPTDNSFTAGTANAANTGGGGSALGWNSTAGAAGVVIVRWSD
jgi:hypothetical protein